MAEERITPKHQVDPIDAMSRDDHTALRYVLQHVRGASPSSMSLLTIEDSDD